MTTSGDAAIHAARERRRALLDAMIEFEAAVTSPVSAPSWKAEVKRHLDVIQAALASHVAEVERPDGIIARALEQAPRLSSRAEILRTDHAQLTMAGHEVRTLLEGLAEEPGETEVDAFRDTALTLLTQLSRHRQRGADLVYDAYDIDIGGTG